MAATIMVKVEIKFDGTDFNDVTQYVQNVSLSYGRSALLEDFSSGGMTITVAIDGRAVIVISRAVIVISRAVVVITCGAAIAN